MGSVLPSTTILPLERHRRKCKRLDIGDCPDIVRDDDGKWCKLDAKFKCADSDWGDLPYKQKETQRTGR